MTVIETGNVSNRAQHVPAPGRATVALTDSRNPKSSPKPKPRLKQRLPWTDSNGVLFNPSGG